MKLIELDTVFKNNNVEYVIRSKTSMKSTATYYHIVGIPMT